MSIVAKTQETVVGATPKVFEALGRIKLLLVVVPFVGVAIGIASQQVTEERNVSTTTFKLGTFATPQRPDPVPLAGEQQMRSRLRANAAAARENDSSALLLSIVVDNDVISATATAEGPEAANLYLEGVVQREISFQNTRLEKLQEVQSARRAELEQTLLETDRLVQSTAGLNDPSATLAAILAKQQLLDNALVRKESIKLELSTMSLLNASDLFIDTSQFIRAPFVIASSNWYRPLIYGLFGLAGGLFLTFLIAIVATVRALTGKKKTVPREESVT